MFFQKTQSAENYSGTLNALPLSVPFSLDLTLRSGQFFQWSRSEPGYIIQTGRKLFYLEQQDDSLCYFSLHGEVSDVYLKRFFRLADDLPGIFDRWSNDPLLRKVYHKYRGLRIIRQEPWECTLSYLCSMASNIPRITGNLRTLAREYGSSVDVRDNTYFLLPTPDQLEQVSLEDLYDAGLGFRSRYIHAIVPRIGQDIDFDRLSDLTYPAAQTCLTEIKGIGEKVADCIQLFSLGNLEAFPTDTWIKKVLYRHYFPKEIRSDTKLTRLARERFGPCAGYAQQYLFHAARQGYIL